MADFSFPSAAEAAAAVDAAASTITTTTLDPPTAITTTTIPSRLPPNRKIYEDKFLVFSPASLGPSLEDFDVYDVSFEGALVVGVDGSFVESPEWRGTPNPGRGGAGVALRVDLPGDWANIWVLVSIAIGRTESSDMAELVAIEHAVEILMANHCLLGSKQRLIIQSDSAVALTVLGDVSGWSRVCYQLRSISRSRFAPGTPREVELATRVLENIALLTLQGVEVVLMWVPGHSGVPCQEAADRLAGKGRREWERGVLTEGGESLTLGHFDGGRLVLESQEEWCERVEWEDWEGEEEMGWEDWEGGEGEEVGEDGEDEEAWAWGFAESEEGGEDGEMEVGEGGEDAEMEDVATEEGVVASSSSSSSTSSDSSSSDSSSSDSSSSSEDDDDEDEEMGEAGVGKEEEELEEGEIRE
ncbi:hypothetical protein B0A50_08407 [Salinomyces thailandicus]|uniref:RNase H type-1 domain-containing protein n=1 Tax=Salinomyces thailandicus TaxID=706561 RepID=A0A4U0TLD4_9PEZI|nr:hypothetical protein B0A50_08407 [Salinomyces thailandica]